MTTIHSGLIAQCEPPSLLQITARDQSSVSVKWNYFQTVAGWELALYKNDETPDFTPQTPIVTEKQYTFNNLEPATAYRIFIRTVCEDSLYSDWNPITTVTYIPQPSPCLLNLPIKNNNCNQGYEDFIIEVQGIDGLLGENVFLESIDLLLEHTWPSDLNLELVSPSGKEISLSRHRGTGSDNYGDIEDLTCMAVTTFSDLACDDISTGTPPFIGAFRPEEGLNKIEDGTSPNGLWKLRVCDRSIPDVGFLRYINLNFMPLLCPLPQELLINTVQGTSINLSWKSFDNCNFLELRVQPVDAEPEDVIKYSLNCHDEFFTIPDLEEGTTYEIQLLSDCFDSKSPLSCPLLVTTLCREATIFNGFDELPVCESSCNTPCPVDEIWRNAAENPQNWLIAKGATPTTGTGPEGDVYNSGNYLYVDSAPDICGSNNKVILESNCLGINATESCNMSFWYHMNGADVGVLHLTVKEEYKDTWDTLFLQNGSSGDIWLQANIDLTAYDDKAATFRFTAELTDGDAGDIAIDEISFLGSYDLGDGITYYQDFDFDGYGNPEFQRTECALTAPTGWVANADDCDDTNPDINPSAEEISCNGIDENCNGLEDDQDPDNPLTYTSTVVNNSCKGVTDGSIALDISGGSSPYEVIWSNGLQGSVIEDLDNGIYTADIIDAGGCRLSTNPISVLSDNALNIIVREIIRPTCDGINDGRIVVQASGGVPDYTYQWNNGMTGDTIFSLGEDTLSVTAIDLNNCTTTSSPIILKSKPQVQVGVLQQRNVTCYGQEDGRIALQVAGGKSPYNYLWNTGDTTSLIKNLPAGSYQATVVDSEGCENTIEIKLSQPEPLKIRVDNKENNPCYGDRLGQIITSTTGGIPPYTYLWNNGSQNDDIYNLPAGAYRVVVTDANACRDTILSVPVLHPSELSGTIKSISPAECRNSKDGSLAIEIQGGKPEYSYYWNEDITGEDSISLINPGLYSVTVIDENECKLRLDNITVPNQELKLPTQITGIDINKCGYDSLSQLFIEVDEATLPIDFNWSSGKQRIKSINKDTLSGLPGGLYSVTATDARGCIGKSDTVELTQFLPITVSASIINNLCYGDEDGSIILNPEGGIAPYEVLWSTGSEEMMISDLGNGSYFAMVTDGNDCMHTSQDFVITSPDSIAITSTVAPSGENDDAGRIELDIAGGTAPYDIQWPEGTDLLDEHTAINLPTGHYDISITDQHDCTRDIQVFVPRISSTRNLENYISIYPNPTTGIFNIKNLTGQQIKEVTIHSVLGKKHDVHPPYQLPPELPAGNYILSITLEDYTMIHHKLMIIPR